MKKPTLFSAILLAAMACLSAETLPFEKAMGAPPGSRNLLNPTTFTVKALPSTVDGFLAFRDKEARDPRGGAAAVALALILYGKDRDLGLSCLTLALDAGLLSASDAKTAVKGFAPSSQTLYLLKQIDKMPWLGNLTVGGVRVETGYRLPPSGPYTFSFHQLTVDKADEVRLYFNTVDGNLPRPLTLKRNDKGIWKGANLSSLLVGPSRMPPKTSADPL